MIFEFLQQGEKVNISKILEKYLYLFLKILVYSISLELPTYNKIKYNYKFLYHTIFFLWKYDLKKYKIATELLFF